MREIKYLILNVNTFRFIPTSVLKYELSNWFPDNIFGKYQLQITRFYKYCYFHTSRSHYIGFQLWCLVFHLGPLYRLRSKFVQICATNILENSTRWISPFSTYTLLFVVILLKCFNNSWLGDCKCKIVIISAIVLFTIKYLLLNI